MGSRQCWGWWEPEPEPEQRQGRSQALYPPPTHPPRLPAPPRASQCNLVLPCISSHIRHPQPAGWTVRWGAWALGTKTSPPSSFHGAGRRGDRAQSPTALHGAAHEMGREPVPTPLRPMCWGGRSSTLRPSSPTPRTLCKWMGR